MMMKGAFNRLILRLWLAQPSQWFKGAVKRKMPRHF